MFGANVERIAGSGWTLFRVASGQRKTSGDAWSLLSWRGWGLSGADWPTRFDGPAEPWPHYPPERWIPAADRAAVICLRATSPIEVVAFDSTDEAVEAVVELYGCGPCGPDCESRHSLVWAVAGVGSFVATLRSDPPVVPRDLSAALAAAGYRTIEGAHNWPAPSILNRPLGPRGVPTVTTPHTRKLQDAAVQDAAGRTIEPTPGGLGGRVVAEHDAAAEALDAGDLDAAFGHDIASEALSRAALAERPSEPVPYVPRSDRAP